MPNWTLIACLVALRDEFNRLAPGRDKGADGSIGDSNHTSTSDHTPDEDSNALDDKDADDDNEVHACDIDSSGPWPVGRSFGFIVHTIIAGEKAKWLSATDKCRLEYVIYNGKIYSRQRDFEPIDYHGSDPHTNHAHFSARYLTETENDTRPWGVIPVVERIIMEFVEYIASLARAVDPAVSESAGERTMRKELEKVVDYFTDRIVARVDNVPPAE